MSNTTRKSTRQLLKTIKTFTGLRVHSISGVYYASLKRNGKRIERSLQTRDRKFAERKLREMRGDFETLDPSSGQTTIQQVLEKFKATLLTKAPKTKATILGALKRFETSWPNGLFQRARDVKSSDLDVWISSNLGDLKPRSFNRYVDILSAAFKFAVMDGVIARNPFESVVNRRKKLDSIVRRRPTNDHFEKNLLDIRNQRFNSHAKESADFLEFLGRAAVGQAEAASLNWPQVDLEKREILFKRVKTGKTYSVPIFDDLLPLMKRARNEATDLNGRVFKINDAKKALNHACLRMGFPKPPFTQRSLRSMRIVQWLQDFRVSPKLVAKWQGHNDGGVLIMNTYSEAVANSDKDAELATIKNINLQIAPTLHKANKIGVKDKLLSKKVVKL